MLHNYMNLDSENMKEVSNDFRCLQYLRLETTFSRSLRL